MSEEKFIVVSNRTDQIELVTDSARQVCLHILGLPISYFSIYKMIEQKSGDISAFEKELKER
jgi:hypothetical protein